MTARLLIGAHPTLGMGFYLSRPGIDVFAASLPDHFLLATSVKNEQVLMTGVVGIGPGGSATVFFPAVLPSPPIVSFIASALGGQIVYPWWGALRPETPAYSMSAVCGTDRVVFTNSSPYSNNFYFNVIARSF